MDVHFIHPKDKDLKAAMDQYTQWLDEQIQSELFNSDQNSDHDEK